jgi:hypothetical protein
MKAVLLRVQRASLARLRQGLRPDQGSLPGSRQRRVARALKTAGLRPVMTGDNHMMAVAVGKRWALDRLER